jgi:hypothetical protein
MPERKVMFRQNPNIEIPGPDLPFRRNSLLQASRARAGRNSTRSEACAKQIRAVFKASAAIPNDKMT